MWEVTSPAGERGWLFGTVHALPDGVDWRTATIDETLAGAGVLVVEVADLDDPRGRALFADLSETPGQQALSSRVEPDERPALLALMDEASAEDGDFTRIESWAAALMLAASVREGDPANGVDRALIADAAASGAEVVELESYAGQLAMFDRLSQAAQDDLLAGVAREFEDDASDGMLRAWLTGNDHRLDEHVNGAMLANPELKRVLLTDRNAAWAERIAALVESGRAPFVAVGAGHVIGERGLLALLAERGYSIRRIQ